jgi:hypothetical protein
MFAGSAPAHPFRRRPCQAKRRGTTRSEWRNPSTSGRPARPLRSADQPGPHAPASRPPWRIVDRSRDRRRLRRSIRTSRTPAGNTQQQTTACLPCRSPPEPPSISPLKVTSPAEAAKCRELPPSTLRCKQVCPAHTTSRAPQDGRMARRCYSLRTSLLSAVRTRIADQFPAHRRTHPSPVRHVRTHDTDARVGFSSPINTGA